MNTQNKRIVVQRVGADVDDGNDDGVIQPIQKSEAVERKNKTGIITSRAGGVSHCIPVVLVTSTGLYTRN